jgi:hypothetical protein
MIKPFLLLAIALAVGSAEAEVYKCVGPSGATEYSDHPCKAGSSSEVIPDHSPLTQQQRDEAQQRAQQQEQAAEALENQREKAESQQEQRAATPAPPPVQAEVIDQGATGSCSDPRRVGGNCARTPYLPKRNPGSRPRPR